MWLASIWRRVVVALAVGGAALISFLVVGPGPSDGYLTETDSSDEERRKLNLLKHLKVRYGYDVPQAPRIWFSKTRRAPSSVQRVVCGLPAPRRMALWTTFSVPTFPYRARAYPLRCRRPIT